MDTTRKLTLSTIFGAALAAASSPTLAAHNGLPSSTDWQAWNTYLAQPSHHADGDFGVHTGSGLPSSTDWQAWNAYLSQPGDSMTQPKLASSRNGLPSSTDWGAWNMHFKAGS
jgi:hypothetical protein